jgi:hypothetical protein
MRLHWGRESINLRCVPSKCIISIHFTSSKLLIPKSRPCRAFRGASRRYKKSPLLISMSKYLKHCETYLSGDFCIHVRKIFRKKDAVRNVRGLSPRLSGITCALSCTISSTELACISRLTLVVSTHTNINEFGGQKGQLQYSCKCCSGNEGLNPVLETDNIPLLSCQLTIPK